MVSVSLQELMMEGIRLADEEFRPGVSIDAPDLMYQWMTANLLQETRNYFMVAHVDQHRRVISRQELMTEPFGMGWR